MDYWLILGGWLLLAVFRYWQDRHLNSRLSILRHLTTLLSITILTASFSYFATRVIGFVLAIISQAAIILWLRRNGSAARIIQKWANRHRQSSSIWLVTNIASLAGTIGIWFVPGVSELFKLILTAIFLCLGVFGVMTRWIRLRAWLMAGIISSTLLGSVHLEGIFSAPAWAASETFAAGAYIIDMGQATQTIATGLKPYGLVYELVVKNAIPVKWAIDPSKARDGADFTANSKTYKGGSFIISSEYAPQAAAAVTAWKSQGVIVDGPLTSGFTAPIYDTITNFPNAVLDFGNGSIAQAYYTNAGIPAASTGTFGTFNTYRFGYPSSLTPCDDIFVMPHADPNWTNHNNLIPFVQSKGFVWAACHAVSVLERIDDPGSGDPDTLPDMNFLSHIPPATQDSKSLKLFGTHAAPTVGPYQYSSTTGANLPYSSGNNLAAFPIMQFLGKIDTATQNGSEQVYVPDVGAQWRNTTAIAVYDQSNTDPVVLNTSAPPGSQAKAAKMAFGPAFGDSNNGMVMYEAGHSHAKAALPDNIAAQRAFLNFNLLNGLVRGMRVAIDVPSTISAGSVVNLATSNNGGAAVAVSGGSGPYSYQWFSSCGGSFSNSTAQNPTFTAPTTGGTCTLRVVVKDGCNRRGFGADTTLISAVVPVTDVSITKNDNVTQVYKGQSVPYTITVTNKGNTTIAGVQISDRAFHGNTNGTVWATSTPSTANGNALSSGTTNPDPFYGTIAKNTYKNDELSVSNISIGSFRNTNGTVVTKIDLQDATASINTYNWTSLNLTPGQSATLTLTGEVNQDTNKNYIANLITVQPLNSSNIVLTDNNTNDNHYYDADKLYAVSNRPDLKVTKTHTPATPKPGDSIVYTVTIQNLSTQDNAATDVVFTDLIPSSINVTGWTCTRTNGGSNTANTSCGVTTGNYGTGNSISYGAAPALTGMKLSKSSNSNTTTLTFVVNGTVTANISNGIITNTATVAPISTDGDPDLSNNTAIDTFTIPTTDLEITK